MQNCNCNAAFIKNSYMSRSQQTVNTTFQNNIKMQYTYIAFSVLDHNSLQCLVIQQLAITELFCTA